MDPDIVRNLADHYRYDYGMRTWVLTPSAVPEEMVSHERDQIDGASLAEYMGKLFPADFQDPNVVLIGLTPLICMLTIADWISSWRTRTGRGQGMPWCRRTECTWGDSSW